jgi:hypothetical protein
MSKKIQKEGEEIQAQNTKAIKERKRVGEGLKYKRNHVPLNYKQNFYVSFNKTISSGWHS